MKLFEKLRKSLLSQGHTMCTFKPFPLEGPNCLTTALPEYMDHRENEQI